MGKGGCSVRETKGADEQASDQLQNIATGVCKEEKREVSVPSAKESYRVGRPLVPKVLFTFF